MFSNTPSGYLTLRWTGPREGPSVARRQLRTVNPPAYRVEDVDTVVFRDSLLTTEGVMQALVSRQLSQSARPTSIRQLVVPRSEGLSRFAPLWALGFCCYSVEALPYLARAPLDRTRRQARKWVRQ